MRYAPKENVAYERKFKFDGPYSEAADFGNRSCLTYELKSGICMPATECYPYTKMHQTISNLETWVMGTRGMCNYAEPSGKQVKFNRIQSDRKKIPPIRSIILAPKFRRCPECFKIPINFKNIINS